MPSNPTTRSQVQAHQFVLRRMQSALVRKDSVMVHDPMRTHSRATIVGAVLGVLGLLGFVIFGLIKPNPNPPDNGIVIGKESGTIYVKTANPRSLTPTFNMASARLIAMAQKERGQGGASGAQSGQPVEVPATEVVPDDQLKDIPRTRLHGIPVGPPLLPSKEQLATPDWAVCDAVQLDRSLPDPTTVNRTETTVFAGVSDIRRQLSPNEALLVTADTGATYLVYRVPPNPNRPNTNTVRARVDLNNKAVTTALNLPRTARHISLGLLNSIPEVDAIQAPEVPGAGESSNHNLGLPVGQVFAVSRAGGDEHWVTTRTGIQKVSRAVADLIRFQRNVNAVDFPRVSADKIPTVKQLNSGDQGYLAVDDYPREPPVVLDAVQNPVTCLGWQLTGTEANQDGVTTVYVSDQLPGPKDNGGKSRAVDVGQPNPDGLKVDKFYMRPGRAAVVRAATSRDSFDKGPIYLITDLGVRYGIPDLHTAQGLGVPDQRPAPDLIVRLLPTGASLNTTDANK